MSVLSVRLPKDLDRTMPRQERSAWVIEAIRDRLRRERIEEIAQSAADHAEQELETLDDWAQAGAPARTPTAARRARKVKR